jgi:hypothetical protein
MSNFFKDPDFVSVFLPLFILVVSSIFVGVLIMNGLVAAAIITGAISITTTIILFKFT